MTPLERLRLATALGHTVPGAQLRLHTDRDEIIMVSHHPAADIDPCAMRRVVAASSCAGQPDLSQRIVDVTICGGLVDTGGGVFSRSVGDVEQRWIASLLQPQRLADLLDDVGLEVVPDDAMSARMKPDSALGVTVLAITVNDARFHHALDEIAARTAAACFVEELRCDAAGTAHSNGRMRGAA
ncbi:MAG: hypothetical protein ACJAXA_002632 [Candidatus Aldehydirespiratoraceae bacterium]|jgi:hypothetical protein